jgi:hypothetical protein
MVWFEGFLFVLSDERLKLSNWKFTTLGLFLKTAIVQNLSEKSV